MTRIADAELLVASIDDIRAMGKLVGEGAPDAVALEEAADLCLEANAALAASIDSIRPRELTEIVIARYRRRWRFRILLATVFIPLSLIGLALFGTALWALVTAFIWRPQ